LNTGPGRIGALDRDAPTTATTWRGLRGRAPMASPAGAAACRFLFFLGNGPGTLNKKWPCVGCGPRGIPAVGARPR